MKWLLHHTVIWKKKKLQHVLWQTSACDLWYHLCLPFFTINLEVVFCHSRWFKVKRWWFSYCSSSSEFNSCLKKKKSLKKYVSQNWIHWRRLSRNCRCDGDVSAPDLITTEQRQFLPSLQASSPRTWLQRSPLPDKTSVIVFSRTFRLCKSQFTISSTVARLQRKFSFTPKI